MDVGRSIVTKVMDQSQNDPRDVENGSSTNMRDTGAKRLLPLLWGGNAEDGLDDEHIVEKNAGNIYT